MSAYIVSNKHINVIVTAYAALAEISDPAELQRIAELLINENHRSVNCRYGSNDVAGPIVYRDEPRTLTVTVLLRADTGGDLVAEHQALEAELRAMGEFVQSHLGEADPRTGEGVIEPGDFTVDEKSHQVFLTEDGHEMQFGTNHLGHFALTLLMLDKMLRLFDFVAVEGGPVAVVFKMLGALIPEYASLAIPLGLLLGVLLAFRKLATSSELEIGRAHV